MVRIVILFIIVCIPSFVSAKETNFIVESIGISPTIEPRKSLIRNILNASEKRFRYTALTVVLDARQIEPRGRMKGRTITLAPSVKEDGEFIKLLIHELGHYIDIYYLMARDGKSDPSNDFYRISWKDKTTKKPNQSLSNFISGYAATNQYEDFAESFTFYMFHNEEFADRAMRNNILREKYLFFSRFIFSEGEFTGTDFTRGKIPGYLWDTTKIPISVKKYLYSVTEFL